MRSRYLGAAGGLGLALLLWQALALVSSPSLLPSPGSTFAFLFNNWQTLFTHFYVTAGQAFVGLLMTYFLVVGIYGIFLLSPDFYRVADPAIVVFQGLPKEACAPLLVAWLGFGFASKAILASAVSFFVVYLGVGSAISNIPSGYLTLYRALRIKRWDVICRVVLPYLRPKLLDLLAPAWLLCIIGSIISEFVGSFAGLGHLIQIYSSQFRMAGVFASLLILGATGYIGVGMAALLRPYVAPWSSRRYEEEWGRLL